MSTGRTAWHVVFAALVKERAPPDVEVRAEVPCRAPSPPRQRLTGLGLEATHCLVWGAGGAFPLGVASLSALQGLADVGVPDSEGAGRTVTGPSYANSLPYARCHSCS